MAKGTVYFRGRNMKDEDKTKEQLMNELVELRRRNAESKRKDKELNEYRENLERMISERTGELEQLNRTLEERIQQSISELRRRDEEEKQRLLREMQRAREMQINLFPQSLLQMPGLDIWGVCHPVSEVGGDLFDYLHLSSDKLCLALGDVSEKGMKGAMNAVMTYGMLHAEARMGISAVTIISELNAVLSACMEETTFTTLSLGIIDVQTKVIQLCNAGNPFPVLFHEGQSSLLELSGLPLGIVPGIDYNEMQFALMPGDVLVLYSDGIVEARRPDDQMYGMDALRDLVGTFQPNLSAQSMGERILQDVRRFVGNSLQSDDMTIIVVCTQEDKEMFID